MGVQISVGVLAFNSSGYIHRGGIAGLYGKPTFDFFFEELPYHFSQQLHQFTFPPAMT